MAPFALKRRGAEIPVTSPSSDRRIPGVTVHSAYRGFPLLKKSSILSYGRI